MKSLLFDKCTVIQILYPSFPEIYCTCIAEGNGKTYSLHDFTFPYKIGNTVWIGKWWWVRFYQEYFWVPEA